MPEIGQTILHYRIVERIGQGGEGYQAKDLKLGRDDAIKVLPEEFAKDADRIARFQREAKLSASPNHSNIAANQCRRQSVRRTEASGSGKINRGRKDEIADTDSDSDPDHQAERAGRVKGNYETDSDDSI